MADVSCFSPEHLTVGQLSRARQPLRVGRVTHRFSQAQQIRQITISKGPTPDTLAYQVRDPQDRQIRAGTIRVGALESKDVIDLLICRNGMTAPGVRYHTVEPMGIGEQLALSIGRRSQRPYTRVVCENTLGVSFAHLQNALSEQRGVPFGLVYGPDEGYFLLFSKGPAASQVRYSLNRAKKERYTIQNTIQNKLVKSSAFRWVPSTRQVLQGTIARRSSSDTVHMLFCPNDYEESGVTFRTLSPVGMNWRLVLAVGRRIGPVELPGDPRAAGTG